MSIESNLSNLDIPAGIRFEQAIALTQSLFDQPLLDQQYQGSGSESALEHAIRALVASENGARGFFVAYLGDERPLVETIAPTVVRALQSAPDIVAPLLVKNLAMSTAMGIYHRRRQDEAAAIGSDRVRARSIQLIQALQTPQLQAHLDQLAASLETGAGEYQSFLTRWGYDSEQLAAISQAIAQWRC